MATATVVSSWQDSACAYLAVRVTGDSKGQDGSPVAMEYIGSVPLADLEGLTAAQKKATLVAAVKAVRDAQRAGAVGLGISGTVTV